jgi:hypothetical protein
MYIKLTSFISATREKETEQCIISENESRVSKREKTKKRFKWI